jgi:hypothetical protein
MKQMTKKELTSLGKDLKEAKMTVLHKHGFSCSEITTIMDIPESVVRRFIDTLENNK